MKNIFIRLISITILVFISANLNAQIFEGEIIYQNSYKSKIPNVTDEKFTLLMGTRQDYFIKGASYKSEINGQLVQWQIYIPAENKMFNKMSNNDSAFWVDAGINSDSVIRVSINKKAATILGYPCDELILICTSGTQKYYFNSSLGIDPKLYKLHKYGNWYAVVSNTRSIPLKIDIDNTQFSMISEAVEVKPGKLDEAIFKLPAGIKTEKSPY